MDDMVLQAMAKWPDVPAAWGWLRLDRRGGWHLVDRNAPGFDETAPDAGSRIEHAAFADFIARNYVADDAGRWYFQNGPQRVFVDVELAPLVLRVFDTAAGPPALVAHTGQPVGRVTRGFLDEAGTVYVETDLGPGVVHDGDLAALEFEPAPDEGSQAMRAMLATGPMLLRPLEQPAEQALGFVRRPRA